MDLQNGYDSVKGEKLGTSLWILVFLSSVLLSVPFLVPHAGLVSLVAFVPLFAAEYLAGLHSKKHFFTYYYVCFLIWNLFTTFWIYKATLAGAVAAIVLNALQMAVIFGLFRWFRKIFRGFLPYVFFIVSWLAWEHAYSTWDVSWPWLDLGNSFATSIKTVQWYSATGVAGGSFWVLLVNVLIFRTIILAITGRRWISTAFMSFFFFLAPLITSEIIFYNYKESSYEPSKKVNARGSRYFSIIQPNIDPYIDKFGGMSMDMQINKFLTLSGKALSSAPGTGNLSHFIIGPETMVYPTEVGEDILLNNIRSNKYHRKLDGFLKSEGGDSLNLNMIYGAVTTFVYNTSINPSVGGDSEERPSASARKFGVGLWYDRFNTAIFINARHDIDFYNKSKLVIIVENSPYKPFLRFLKKHHIIDLEKYISSFGTQKERTVFTTTDSVKIGTAICYESVFGDFYRHYILAGANVMSVITNDGWWGNTPGYRQHLSYSCLRAIETRRSIARCGNTGISALINQRGEIIAETPWWKEAYLNGSLKLNDKITPFVKYGDVIGRISEFVFFLMFLLGISRFLMGKKGKEAE
ncbi:MAG: apolipoprotein N-acyltransferase [Bacteroidales bacterium]|jgi:apolipoprotein N-acyltransferase|nr:apolipoprotein N-acyltransferase [Bacteroidales bacterium]